MKQRPPAISPLLRTDFQGELLAALFLHPDQEYTLTDLANLLTAGLSTVHTEIERLSEAELTLERRIGRARLVRANDHHPLTPSLTELLTLTYGPPAVLPSLLAKVRGVERAYIYGSWAARRHGETGPYPEDIDVLVIGDASGRALSRVQAEATEALRRDVNLTIVSAEEWDQPTTGFTQTVRRAPLVELDLES